MPYRFVLYDALCSLDKGHSLIKVGDGASYNLENCPKVYYVVVSLVQNGWIKPINETTFTITDKGKHAFAIGRKKYQRMPWIFKVLGRLGILDVPW